MFSLSIKKGKLKRGEVREVREGLGLYRGGTNEQSQKIDIDIKVRKKKSQLFEILQY
jgi:hypothetical protein